MLCPSVAAQGNLGLLLSYRSIHSRDTDREILELMLITTPLSFIALVKEKQSSDYVEDMHAAMSFPLPESISGIMVPA